MVGLRLLQIGGLLLTSAALVTAGPYFSENFDLISPQLYTYSSGSGLAIGSNFLLTSGSVDVVGGSYFPGLCEGAATGICVDLNGMTPGTLVSQPFNLPSGSFYLNFVLNGTGSMRPLKGLDDQAQARVTMASPTGGTFFDQVFTLPYNTVGSWQISISVPVTPGAGTGTRITFASSNPTYVSAAVDSNAPATGLVLDSVSVTDNFSDTTLPEPATVFGGLLALPLIWIARKRFVA